MAKYSELQIFYASDRYRSFRLMIISERGLRCEECGRIPERARDLHLHHEIELTLDNYRDATISLNPALAKLKCSDCHNKGHRRFGYAPAKMVYLVYGPPCSGKAEYVEQTIRRGDLLVDMDMIYQAISGLPLYDKPDNLLSNAFSVQNALLDNIKVRYGKWYSAYVVGGYPEKRKREGLADEIGAELVFCEASMAQCIARMIECKEITNKEAWKGYIEKWFQEFQP